jgi:hypothetical protein
MINVVRNVMVGPHTLGMVSNLKFLRDKVTHLSNTLINTQLIIMSKTVMLSLLAQGNTGNELLQILDTLIDDNQTQVAYAEPTADVIEF